MIAAAVAAIAFATAASPITQARSGQTFHVAPHGALTLRLSERWLWTEPVAGSAAVELIPVDYFRDPGFREWRVVARRAGRATIRSTGRPACGACGDTARSFVVTVVVAR